MFTEVMDRPETKSSENRDQDRRSPHNEDQPLSGPPAHAGPLPIPASMDLPVSHRQPDIPSYHLWGSVGEICRERGQVGQAEEACVCGLLGPRSQAMWGTGPTDQ